MRELSSVRTIVAIRLYVTSLRNFIGHGTIFFDVHDLAIIDDGSKDRSGGTEQEAVHAAVKGRPNITTVDFCLLNLTNGYQHQQLIYNHVYIMSLSYHNFV